MSISGETYEEAKAIAEAVYKILSNASDSEKKVIEKLIKSEEPITHIILTKDKIEEYKELIDTDESLIRIDKDGMYHILTLSKIDDEAEEAEDVEEDTEAKALKRLRGKKENEEITKEAAYHQMPSPAEIERMTKEERFHHKPRYTEESPLTDEPEIEEQISRIVSEKINGYVRSVRQQLDDAFKEIRTLQLKIEEVERNGRQSSGNAD